MPVSDDFIRLPLGQIYVARDERQRRGISTKGLLESIKQHGVLHPIIIERAVGPAGQHRLIVGERRYQASMELGLPDIPIRFADDLSQIERQILELEENLKRVDLEWPEIVRATQQIHALYCELKPGWTQDDTTETLGLTKGSVSLYLRVASELDTNEKVASSNTVKEAYNHLLRKDARREAEILSNILAPSPSPSPSLTPNPAGSILHESFIYWAPKYTGPLFNFIHCDFPYGINIFNGPQAGGDHHAKYSDTSDIHFVLLKTLLTNFNRLASVSCHIIYWFSMQHYDQIRKMFAELQPSLSMHRHPLIWLKSDNTGIAADSQRGPRHVYETALLLSRGDRKIVQIVADAYAAPTDHAWHIHTKPEPMLKHFFTMLVDEHTSLLDPTCGSGAALRAAEALGASRVLGMDTDEQIVGQARQALRRARILRGST